MAGFKRNSAACLVVDYSRNLLSGFDDDSDEFIRITPVNEEDEFTIGSGGCASINVRDNSAYIVEIDFSNCSASVDAIRRSKSLTGPNQSDYLGITDVCSGESFFSNCVYPLTNSARTFGSNPTAQTVRFLAVNPVFNDAVFN